MVRASAPGAVGSGVIPSRTNDFKLVSQLPCLALSIREQCGEEASKFIRCAVRKGS